MVSQTHNNPSDIKRWPVTNAGLRWYELPISSAFDDSARQAYAPGAARQLSMLFFGYDKRPGSTRGTVGHAYKVMREAWRKWNFPGKGDTTHARLVVGGSWHTSDRSFATDTEIHLTFEFYGNDPGNNMIVKLNGTVHGYLKDALDFDNEFTLQFLDYLVEQERQGLDNLPPPVGTQICGDLAWVPDPMNFRSLQESEEVYQQQLDYIDQHMSSMRKANLPSDWKSKPMPVPAQPGLAQPTAIPQATRPTRPMRPTRAQTMPTHPPAGSTGWFSTQAQATTARPPVGSASWRPAQATTTRPRYVPAGPTWGQTTAMHPRYVPAGPTWGQTTAMHPRTASAQPVPSTAVPAIVPAVPAIVPAVPLIVPAVPPIIPAAPLTAAPLTAAPLTAAPLTAAPLTAAPHTGVLNVQLPSSIQQGRRHSMRYGQSNQQGLTYAQAARKGGSQAGGSARQAAQLGGIGTPYNLGLRARAIGGIYAQMTRQRAIPSSSAMRRGGKPFAPLVSPSTA